MRAPVASRPPSQPHVGSICETEALERRSEFKQALNVWAAPPQNQVAVMLATAALRVHQHEKAAAVDELERAEVDGDLPDTGSRGEQLVLQCL